MLLIGGLVIKTLSDAGEFKKTEPHFYGKVSMISGITGGEDITIDHGKRIAYISADDRFATLNGRKGFGGFYALYLDNPDLPPILVKRIPENEIHPHGISYYKTKEGQAYLYAVDHAGGKHSILLFQFQDDTTLALLKTFADSSFIISPNDVAAVDEHRFFFTNDHGSASDFGKMMEDYLQLAKSNVVYFDGKEYSAMAEKIAYANGINISHDGKEIYVAACIGKRILVYDHEMTSGKLSLQTEIDLNTGVDNIELDESGNLWVACHPQLLTFVKHARDTSRLAPSQVIKITKDSNGNFLPQEIFLNKGEEISASSVAAVAGNILLIGPVLDNVILRCEQR